MSEQEARFLKPTARRLGGLALGAVLTSPLIVTALVGAARLFGQFPVWRVDFFTAMLVPASIVVLVAAAAALPRAYTSKLFLFGRIVTDDGLSAHGKLLAIARTAGGFGAAYFIFVAVWLILVTAIAAIR